MKLLVLVAIAALALAAGCGSADESADPGPTEAETQPTALPDVARVVCEQAGTRVETPTVKPQADGVHFEIVNDTGAERAISVLDNQGGGMGQGAPAGTSTLVSDLSPGTLEISCSDPAADVEAGVPVEVVDEDGLYVVGGGLDCEMVTSGILDYVAGAKGEPTPEEAVRKNEGDRIQPDDVLAAVGYPEAAGPTLGLTRDGTAIAGFQVIPDGSGGWLLSMSSFCPPYGER